MRILHTADWHIGRRLGRHDRTDETRAALDEVVRIADEERVDLVLVSGDVFDRPVPPVEALSLGLGALLAPRVPTGPSSSSPGTTTRRSCSTRSRRCSGNAGCTLIGAIRSPDAGGLLGPEELGVGAVVAAFPFLREGRVVDFMAETGRWYGQYAQKVAAITAAYNEALIARAGDDLVPILVAHFMVNGVRVSHSERELHIGDAYTATAQAIPPGPQYVALGHIHAPQSGAGRGGAGRIRRVVARARLRGGGRDQTGRAGRRRARQPRDRAIRAARCGSTAGRARGAPGRSSRRAPASWPTATWI